jgi:hypothetical protein
LAWLRRARWLGTPYIDPITYDVVVWVIPRGEDQRHPFYLSANGQTVRDLDINGVCFAGQDPLGRGRYLGFTRSDPGKSGLFWWPYSGGKPHLIVADQGSPGSVQPSPDGRWLAAMMPSGFYVGRYDGASLRSLNTDHRTVHKFQWSPDGRALFLLITEDDERQLVRFRPDMSRMEPLIFLPSNAAGHGFSSFNFCGPSDGQHVLLSEMQHRWTSFDQGGHIQYEGWLWIVDPAKSIVRSRIWWIQGNSYGGEPLSDSASFNILGWHPDGRLLARRGRALVAFDPDTREEEVLVRWGK